MTTGFFGRVYRLVRQTPPGKVTSYGAIARMLGYGAIARMLGHPRAARTVGWALHSLPEDSDVPWQRVINSQGRISTSCREHSASLQRTLLEAEGKPRASSSTNTGTWTGIVLAGLGSRGRRWRN